MIIVILIGIIFSAPLYHAAMNYAGYCVADGRFLNDKEKVSAAISYINSLDTVSIVIDNQLETLPQIKYKSVADFLEANPNCCKVGLSGFSADLWNPTFLEKAQGLYADRVQVRFKLLFTDKAGTTQTTDEEWDYVIGNCGKIR